MDVLVILAPDPELDAEIADRTARQLRAGTPAASPGVRVQFGQYAVQRSR
jgi:hypothetical protein